jgi:8-hydroxy-5-deazaflavin:NADPH oxidoreductase
LTFAVASTLRRDAGFDPVILGPLERAKDFAQGAPLHGREITAQEMQQRLNPEIPCQVKAGSARQ